MPTHKNPFPGMNPYFESTWNRVHTRLIAYISDTLAGELPEGLNAIPEESVMVTGDESPSRYRADVAITDSRGDGFPPIWQADAEANGAIAVAEPLVFHVEPEVQRWVEIREVSGDLVTVIEVLSPSNKTEDGAQRYRKKQSDLLNAGIALVEIDLVRTGRQVTALPDMLKFPTGTCYHICVARPYIRGLERREVYLAPLREPLPAIRIPLRQGDPDVPLALQSLIEKCFQNGRYWQEDYSHDPHPPVAPEDAAWLADCLRAEGLRQ